MFFISSIPGIIELKRVFVIDNSFKNKLDILCGNLYWYYVLVSSYYSITIIITNFIEQISEINS